MVTVLNIKLKIIFLLKKWKIFFSGMILGFEKYR